MPPGQPLRPTYLMLLVALVWLLVDWALQTSWLVTWLVSAIALQGALWVHVRWARRRQARARDASRPYPWD
ncbi:hypothetical protein [Solirubrobacter phytolaccae]|uniref:hypothetical protein n=1 Tax=Solirubrobacter phytolaccae TaxID=1404360 RepID=UPI0022CE18C5|nr:hypothetical protein [Solirubrobacter phytolaccae]